MNLLGLLLALTPTPVALAVPAASATPIIGDQAIDDFIVQEDDSRHIVDLDYRQLRRLAPKELVLDAAFDLSLIHRGTPYLWGGDDWKKGIDCSHFTWRIFEAVGTGYEGMMTTSQLRDIDDGHGLRAIPLNDARPGDLFVYGYYDDANAWHGHVVILVDERFEAGGYRGLVVGSHGSIGVQYITYQGFPFYFREPNIILRKVLRVKTAS